MPFCYSFFCFLALGNGALLSHIQHCYVKHLCICIRICGEGLTAFSHRLIKIVDTPLLSGLISLDENTTRYIYTYLFPCRLLAHDPFYQGDKSVQDIDCKRSTRVHTGHHIIPIMYWNLMEAELYSFSAALARVALLELCNTTFVSTACLPDPCCLLGVCIRIHKVHLTMFTQITTAPLHIHTSLRQPSITFQCPRV